MQGCQGQPKIINQEYKFMISRRKFFSNAVVTAGAAVLGASFGWGIHALDFWWLTIGVTLLVLPLNLRLYTPVARFFFIVSQATFAIFLLHRFVYEIYEHVPVPQNQNAEWLVGFFGSIGLWMAAVIPLRAYRAIVRRHGNPSTGALMLQR